MKKILIIKTGALGDIVHSLTTIFALHNKFHHSQFEIITKPAYANFMKRLGIFSKVHILPTKSFGQLFTPLLWLAKNNYDMVIDLQNKEKSKFWSIVNVIKTLNWYGNSPFATKRFVYEKICTKAGCICRAEYFLQIFSIAAEPQLHNPNLITISNIKIPHTPYALIIPDASKTYKKWGDENYQEIIHHLTRKNITPYIIGKDIQHIDSFETAGASLAFYNKTDFFDIIRLASGALFAIGNDTGPQMLAACGGTKTITLYCPKYPPEQVGPYGENEYSFYDSEKIANIRTEDVKAQIDAL